MPRRVEGGPWGRATGQHPSFRANKEPSYTTQEIASGPGSHVESMRRCQQTNASTLTLPHRRWTPPCSFARLQENISISNSVLSSALTLWDILPENHTSDSQVLKHVRSSCCFLQTHLPGLLAALNPRRADAQTPPSEGPEITQEAGEEGMDIIEVFSIYKQTGLSTDILAFGFHLRIRS